MLVIVVLVKPPSVPNALQTVGQILQSHIREMNANYGRAWKCSCSNGSSQCQNCDIYQRFLLYE